MEKVCESFNELKTLCKKYGVAITEQSLYRQRLFGKSGYYGPIDEKMFIAYNERWCSRVLCQLKKDIEQLTEKYGNCCIKLNKYDDIDVANSIRNLTECYGYREVYLTAHPLD